MRIFKESEALEMTDDDSEAELVEACRPHFEQSLKALAAEACLQVEVFQPWGVFPDIVTDFVDGPSAVFISGARSSMSDDAQEALEKLESAIKAIPIEDWEPEDDWDNDTKVLSRSSWTRVRWCATDLMSRLDLAKIENP